jgi:hypothetical protein
MLLLLALACVPSATVTLDDSDAPCAADTAATTTPDPLVSGAFADTEVPDWMPVLSGNWPNGLTADACNNPTGPTCYDCLHVPTGTYARWFRVETEGGGYVDDQWFEATLGQLAFTDFDAESGAALGTDGTYYAFEPAQACAPVYWLY